MDDWVASAANEDVVSWYNLRACASEEHLRAEPRGRADVPVRLLVEAVALLDLIEGVLLERGLDPVQDVEDVVLFRPVVLCEWVCSVRSGGRTSRGGSAARD